MSGLSLGVAPPSDHVQTASSNQKQPTVMSGVMGSLRVIELQLVAFIMVFSASGLVPFLDLIFPAFATGYILLISRLAFPAVRSRSNGGREIFKGGKLFRGYVVMGTTVGLFLPLAYVLGGFARGDDHAVRSATPHLYLLSFQILTENIISGLEIFSPPVRAMVPLLYTVRRIFVVLDWLYDVCLNKTLPATATFQDVAWMWFGRVLAMANMIYFCINLFGFLLPQFLPRAFEKYFKERDEISAKMAEDKRASASITHDGSQDHEAKSHETKKSD